MTTKESKEAKEQKIPICAATMGCLCWGHAIGDDADAPCNTDERRSADDIDTVTEDKTPTVTPTFEVHPAADGPDRCASCGETVSLTETAWLWRGRIFCDKIRCKPRRRAAGLPAS